ncbi:PH domain-containing protein [Paenibacillus daejeonensis]|uniref:PH domain-containing protein n=1 Tax=Paenibacillus daejeonensis TaxID=135193 RepID=UPI000366CF71|nr:PH domain-containing protein [Paenibacillus daejeonensis]
MTFRPKRDRWLSILIWGTILLMTVVGLTPMLEENPHPSGLVIALIICWGCAAFVAWIWLDMRYTFTQEQLVLKSGPFVKRIPYESVQSVRPTRSVMSSAATSIDRLEIRYGRFDDVHVSPLEEARFIEELRRRCPGLQSDGEISH